MSFSTARTCAFASRSAISRHSADRSLHSLDDVIIGYSPNRTNTPSYHRNRCLSFFSKGRTPRACRNSPFSDLHWGGPLRTDILIRAIDQAGPLAGLAQVEVGSVVSY